MTSSTSPDGDLRSAVTDAHGRSNDVIHTFWSVKGGSGVTVTAAVFAAGLARRAGPTLLVDLCGDQPAALGRSEPVGAGWTDWLATPDGADDAIDRLAVRVDDELSVLPVGGRTTWDPGRVPRFAAALSAMPHVVVDAGVLDEEVVGVGVPQGGSRSPGTTSPAAALRHAGRSTLVVRPCYLALRRAMRASHLADDLVVLEEPDRALTARDVAEVLDLDLRCSIEVSSGVARSVDAGTLLHRRHRWAEPMLHSA